MDIILQEPHPKQKYIIDNAKRFNVCCMGRRFGKTALGLDILIDGRGGKDKCLLNGYPVAWFAPNGKLFNEVWNEAKRILRPIMIDDGNKSEGVIKTITGGWIDFWTLHNTDDPARGRKYGAIVVDESAIAKRLEIQWKQALRATLIDYEGSAWFMSTPKPNSYFKTLYDRCSELDENGNKKNIEWQDFKASTYDNPYMPNEEIEKSRLDMTRLEASQEIDAEFIMFKGDVINTECFISIEKMPAEIKSCRFWDIAVSIKKSADESAGALCGYDEGKFYTANIKHGKYLYPDLKELIIKTAIEDTNKVPIVLEEAGQQKGFIDDLQREPRLAGFIIKGQRPDGDKTMRAGRWFARAEQGHYYLVNGSFNTHFVAQCSAFTLDDSHKHDDLIDAVSGAYQYLANVKSVRIRRL